MLSNSRSQVKIADFGLSRQGLTYQMSDRPKVPIRWMAPESLRTGYYSQKTEVWSFGILCWEIFHNGAGPYPEMTLVQVNQKVEPAHILKYPSPTSLFK